MLHMSNRRFFEMTKIPMIFTLCALLVTLASSFVFKNPRMMEMKECLKSTPCQLTFDLAPICASDGRTYSNERFIECLNGCLKEEDKLTVSSRGYCKPLPVRWCGGAFDPPSYQ